MLQIYNTLTRKKEVFKPKNQDNVKVYFCGPTPYNFAHIGNLKTYVFEDVVIRTLRFLGYTVKSTMNITDIDDKTIRDSQKQGETLLGFTQKYTKIFFEDLEKLSVIPADNISPISQLIPEMVHIINILLKKGFAYIADDGSVYYSVSKFSKYGELANLHFSGMKSSVRINNDEYEKENVGDFVLWKAFDSNRDGNNYWEAVFIVDGKEKKVLGRPGWHIECSACNMKFFGPEIDLHMGGVDLVFPHHQNEVAQTEAATGKRFSRFWMHSGHLMIEGKKMSKSLGNFYTLRDIEDHFPRVSKDVLYRAVRLAFISGKYRDTLDFSFTKLEQSIATIEKIDETTQKIFRTVNVALSGKVERTVSQKLQEYVQKFIENLEDDINTPEVLSSFFELLTFVNTYLSGKRLIKEELISFIDMFKTFDQVLGILLLIERKNDEIPHEIQTLFEQRIAAKKDKNFDKADKIREKLISLGYKIIDERTGARLERI